MRVRSVVAALVNSVLINVPASIAEEARRMNMGIRFTNHYHEESQKPASTYRDYQS